MRWFPHGSTEAQLCPLVSGQFRNVTNKIYAQVSFRRGDTSISWDIIRFQSILDKGFSAAAKSMLTTSNVYVRVLVEFSLSMLLALADVSV